MILFLFSWVFPSSYLKGHPSSCDCLELWHLASWISFLPPQSEDSVIPGNLELTTFHRSHAVGSTHRRSCLYFTKCSGDLEWAPETHQRWWSCGSNGVVGWKWSRALSTTASLLPCWLANILPKAGQGLVLPLLPESVHRVCSALLCHWSSFPFKLFWLHNLIKRRSLNISFCTCLLFTKQV